jgi:protease I
VLKGKKVAILLEHHYQDMEAWYPYYRLKEEGADVVFAGTGSAKTYSGKYGYPAEAQTTAGELKAGSLDAVVIPGGWAPDFLRRHESVLKLVREMNGQGKIVAAICHAGWVLASAKIVSGRTVTCFSAIKDDLIHAGAKVVDKEVAVDKNLITSRTPDDLPAFCREIIKALA